jgi:hypothetical protein
MLADAGIASTLRSLRLEVSHARRFNVDADSARGVSCLQAFLGDSEHHILVPTVHFVFD